MLTWLSAWLQSYLPPLNVVRYTSFRVIAAMVTAALISLYLFPRFIRFLQMKQIGQVIRHDGPEGHFSKRGTPTIGGALILIALTVSTLLWMDLSNLYVWATLGVTVSLGCVGFWDDYLKVSKKSSAGLSGRGKLVAQFTISFIALGALLWKQDGFYPRIYLPFVDSTSLYIDLPVAFFLLFGGVVITGTSNAVNLTDGLDGLAIGPVIVATATFLIIAYVTGAVLKLPLSLSTPGAEGYFEFNLARYLYLPHLPEVSEVAVFAAALIGAGLGFLWYNAYPAQVFMGDTGSLALGGAIGMLAVCTRSEVLSVIICGIFVLEAVSVILQTSSYKLRGGKRVFLMAPIHHHFEKLGWTEPKIVVRFWIISFILSLLALASLKIR